MLQLTAVWLRFGRHQENAAKRKLISMDRGIAWIDFLITYLSSYQVTALHYAEHRLRIQAS